MKKRILCISLIVLFLFSVVPVVFASTDVMSNPVKVTQEIDPETYSISDNSNKFSAVPTLPDVTMKGKPAPTPKNYALKLEIDWIDGHYPDIYSLDYLVSYYANNGITITYTVSDDAVPLAKVGIDGASDTEFWAIEYEYNEGDDKATSSSDGKYTLPDKWVLYGTTVQGEANIVGYTYCVGTFRDLVAGNYIYIADATADAWAETVGVPEMGAETTVLMHEFGHSIGICVVRAGTEVYCSDYYCVMSYLRAQNAGNTGKWYYCSTHWKTKNLDYYVV